MSFYADKVKAYKENIMPIICNREESIFVIQTKNSSYVIIENCASGGRRADLSISEYCSRINGSDNQNPRDEIFFMRDSPL